MSEGQPAAKLGTFLGVFTPTILTVLGVIMYLRVGWVVGNAGWALALSIVVLANAITFISALSVSSIATNMRVGAGGAYYIISRSLGLELGGAIGLPLFLSQAVSVTLYCYGLAEAITMFWPDAPVMPLAGVFVVLVSLLAGKSTVLALKMQLPIMVAVVGSIIALMIGADWGSEWVAEVGEFPDVGYWGVFAVFFPAVTGILAGVSMSGDLKDPERSLPLGTMAGVIVGFAVYLVVPLALASSVGMVDLREDSLIWTQVAIGGSLVVFPGLLGAILSSAIGSILGAPRTLQALAVDGLVHNSMAGTNERGEPQKALIVSGVIAFVAVFLGDLNAVAAVVTMFFLTTYGVLNIVCALEGLVGDPSFRPRFRVHWVLPLMAALGCFAVMVLINPIASLLAIAAEVALWFYLSRRSMQATWGDMRGGVLMSMARWALLAKRDREEHQRNWRPQVLVYTDDVEKDLPLIKLASGLSLRRGVVTVARIVEGDLDEVEVDLEKEAAYASAFLDDNGVTAFCEVNVVDSLETGFVVVAQANGIAGLHSNTAVFGWPSQQAAKEMELRVLRKLDHVGKSVVLARLLPDKLPKKRRVIVWWAGKQDNGDLMLLLAHVLVQNRSWRETELMVKSVVFSEDDREAQRLSLIKLCTETRIEARAEIIVKKPDETVQDIIQEHSRDATLVLLGLRVPEKGGEAEAAERIDGLLHGLPNALLVRNSGAFRGALLDR
mgnify:CR=1 FL=1